MSEKKNPSNQEVSTISATPKELNEFDLAQLIAKREYFFIIDRLRQGPVERGTMHKFFKAKFPRELAKPREFFETLINQNIIREYEYKKEKPNPDGVKSLYPDMKVGDSATFYLLVKDFYAIRKPPMELLEKLESLGLPPKIIKEFRKEIQDYFNKYTNRKIAGDDNDVINLFMDQKLVAAISYLTNNIYKMNDLSDEMKKQGYNEPTKVFSKLKEKDFIKIIEIPEQKGSIVLLKTAVEMQPIFPEYLIKSINQIAAEKKIDKEFAIITLYQLKRAYLELEKPEMLEEYKRRAEQIKEKMNPLLDKWKNGDKTQAKNLNKHYQQLIEVMKEMGDLNEMQKIQKEWDSIQQPINN